MGVCLPLAMAMPFALLWQIVPKVLEKFGAWDVAPATEKLKGAEFATGGGA